MIGLMKDMENLMHLGLLGDDDLGLDSLLSDEEKQEAKVREEALFKDHPPRPDCDICFNQYPWPLTKRRTSCVVVRLYVMVVLKRSGIRTTGRRELVICAHSAASFSTSSNTVELVKKRMELNDPDAFMVMAHITSVGTYGHKKDEEKAVSLMEKARELGSVDANTSLGFAYLQGTFGLQKDIGKAKRYLETRSY